MWWNTDNTVLHLRGDLPDLLGAKVEATINEVMEEMKPAEGEPWDTRDRRAADALGVLCERDAGADDAPAPTPARRPVLSVQVPVEGTATVAGVPLPDAVVEQLRANATIEPVLVDEHGAPVAVGRRTSAISPKVARSVLLRDGHCRCGGCEIRHGLEIHHLVPRSWGGTDEISNLVAVFAAHHRELAPHGPWALVGNPNLPDGLERGSLRRAHTGTGGRVRPPASTPKIDRLSGAGTNCARPRRTERERRMAACGRNFCDARSTGP
jgi:hypothetical protein